jgi:hypothetical protein
MNDLTPEKQWDLLKATNLIWGRCSMDELSAKLRKLIEDTCKHPPRSVERQKGLTEIIRAIEQSGRLWQENIPDYEDALQQTWLYLCRNLCEANTAQQPYDPNRSSVITWLDKYLKRRLQDFRIEADNQKARTVQPIPGSEEKTDPVDNLPAGSDRPLAILEETIEWVQTDPDGELSRVHINGHPEVNCQVLILRCLPHRTSWKKLSEEFGLPISTLNSFYRRQCLPRLRKFAESEGYLNED